MRRVEIYFRPRNITEIIFKPSQLAYTAHLHQVLLTPSLPLHSLDWWSRFRNIICTPDLRSRMRPPCLDPFLSETLV